MEIGDMAESQSNETTQVTLRKPDFDKAIGIIEKAIGDPTKVITIQSIDPDNPKIIDQITYTASDLTGPNAVQNKLVLVGKLHNAVALTISTNGEKSLEL